MTSTDAREKCEHLILLALGVAVCLAFSAFYEFTEWWAARRNDET